MNTIRQGWKILTHDWRSPLQGGEPICDGQLPVTLPLVQLDTGSDECAAGWNYVEDIATGWRIAGLWPTGYPARIVAVEASLDAIGRGDKRRASQLTLMREATAQEVHAALVTFSCPFGKHASRMVQEQTAWRAALVRPHHDPAKVEVQLALALSSRALPWNLRHFETARAAWVARDTGAVWDDRHTRVTSAPRATKALWAAWAAWAVWATWDASAARDTWDAWNALTTFYARLSGWQAGEPEQYTVGIRDAYMNGLALALPVGLATLGWAMERGEGGTPWQSM